MRTEKAAAASAKNYTRYTDDVKLDAIRLVRDGESRLHVARRLGIRSPSSITHWMQQWKGRKAASKKTSTSIDTTANPAATELKFLRVVIDELGKDLRALGGSPGPAYIRAADREEFRGDVLVEVKIRR